MIEQSNKSFIPKQTPGKLRNKPTTGKVINLFGYISYTVFLGGLFLTLGVYFFSYYIQSTLVDQQGRLADLQKEFQQTDIDELAEFNSYLRTAEGIHSGSFSLLPVLTDFEQVVTDPVVFDTMSLVRNNSDIIIEVAAVAESFDATLFQRQQIEDVTLLASSTVTDALLVQDIQVVLDQFIDADNEPERILLEAELEQLLSSVSSDQFVTFNVVIPVDTSDLPFSLDNYTFGNPGLPSVVNNPELIVPDPVEINDSNTSENFFEELE